ncbi:glycoprotein-N-acetylgalactosamine 3-beta-galactosyltransferase 1-B-like isoform X2 [Gigantopelta aegis]|uniref:glycoprotein-N-acetylgalactosamine 3-beta-galactosyltransferase 1-B-like isoform X2 n=1 Tax=Gigantopelta aegis TaxID=1735272 RepID=UPI001B88A685|nr:glycoprotein-N-acetylgalactosamine 3-beta-galactosyltransferase 1-B-like isoform X2 [Gigantopelta aegis]
MFVRNVFKSASSQFVLGITVGLVVSFIFTGYNYSTTVFAKNKESVAEFRHTSGRRIGISNVPETHEQQLNNAEQEHERAHRQLDTEIGKSPEKIIKFVDEHKHHDDDHVAKDLAKKVRVLCWVMTSPNTLQKKARVVKETWGKRCNVMLFFSSVSNSTFPVIGLNVSEGREHLTAKTMQAFYYIYQHHLNDADWFMKTDDDTYVIVENLRYFLSSQNSSRPVFFGHHFKTIVKQGYYSGGGGYVLSKEALTRFGIKGKNDSKLCRTDGGAEDAVMGICMQNLGVKTGNSTDSLGRTRFHCFDPETHLFGGFPDWYYHYDANGVKKGIDSISDYAISFHYVPFVIKFSFKHVLFCFSRRVSTV